jgi:glutamine phosphoribosylpyrophosphate amidotransferase
LAIVDPASGKQPLFSADGKLVLAANGEIYNHRDLRKQLQVNIAFKQKSDWQSDFNIVQREKDLQAAHEKCTKTPTTFLSRMNTNTQILN